MKFHIDNMVCDGCARGVARAIQAVDPDAKVIADPPKRVVEVSTCASHEQIADALREAEFPATVA